MIMCNTRVYARGLKDAHSDEQQSEVITSTAIHIIVQGFPSEPCYVCVPRGKFVSVIARSTGQLVESGNWNSDTIIDASN